MFIILCLLLYNVYYIIITIKSNLRGEGLFNFAPSGNNSSLREVVALKPGGGSWSRDHERTLLINSLTLANLSAFRIQLSPPCPEIVLPTGSGS